MIGDKALRIRPEDYQKAVLEIERLRKLIERAEVFVRGSLKTLEKFSGPKEAQDVCRQWLKDAGVRDE